MKLIMELMWSNRSLYTSEVTRHVGLSEENLILDFPKFREEKYNTFRNSKHLLFEIPDDKSFIITGTDGRKVHYYISE